MASYAVTPYGDLGKAKLLYTLRRYFVSENFDENKTTNQ